MDEQKQTESKGTEGIKATVRIESIKVKRLDDENPDLSHLESSVLNGKIDSCCYSQEDYDNDRENTEKYIRQDNERLESYGSSWWMLGVVAEAQVSYDIGQGNRRLECFTSGGIWGVESDSGEDYFETLEQEELNDLKQHLETFGVDVSNFDEKILV